MNEYLKCTPGNHERVFTSLDVIEDCQDAIEEYANISIKNFPKRSTLYIYGVLQAMYCQQDGLFQLYKTIIDDKIENVYKFFEKYKFSKTIREVRGIAGHPTNRKGKEFYFIAKGQNTKYRFSYGGYTPDFKKVDVDLCIFIEQQK